MNDDLEHELAKLRPAAAPPDLMRKLRSVPPLRRKQRHWLFLFGGFQPATPALLACAALLMATWWLVSSWQASVPTPSYHGGPRLTGTTRTGEPSSADTIPTPSTTKSLANPGVANNPPPLENPPESTDVFSRRQVGLNVSLAALGGGRADRRSDFDLATTDGPFRLETGTSLLGSHLRETPFGGFHLIGGSN